ncbi:MAG TPA: PilN domain-containing protein [Nitrospiraceae bacterium]|nr:PilN domain-containing protein [Nitrospiraceae bacterium]
MAMRLAAAAIGIQRTLSRVGMSAPRDRLFVLNLSGRYRWYIGPARALIVTVSAALCLVMLWELREAWDIRQEIETMTATLARVQEQDRELSAKVARQGIDLSDSAIQMLPKEVAFANQLIAKRGFSWTRFLTELEQSIPPRIAVNSIRLDPANSVVHLTGSALNLEDVTALTIMFQDHARFKDPVLGQHRDAGNGLVEFDLSLRYKSHSS